MSGLWRRFEDWYWHVCYWRAVRRWGTADERTTDLAERCVDARLALWRHQ